MSAPAPPAVDPFSAFTADLDHAIEHAVTHQPRSLQQRLGPSEIGCPCDRRLGYKLAGVPACHHPLKWEAYIGIGVHAQLARDFGAMTWPPEQGTGPRRFLVEQKLGVGQAGGDDIDGTTDLYDLFTARVIDWKIVGKASLARYRSQGPGDEYRVQGHTYGRGWRKRGFPVTDIVIAFLPRSEKYARRYFWHEPYDEQVVLKALTRVDAIAAAVRVAGRQALPLLRTAEAHCLQCPWFRPGSPDLTGGCPGELDLPRTRPLLELIGISPKESP